MMSNLRQGIGLYAYGQRDPLVMYKKQGHDAFDELQETHPARCRPADLPRCAGRSGDAKGDRRERQGCNRGRHAGRDRDGQGHRSTYGHRTRRARGRSAGRAPRDAEAGGTRSGRRQEGPQAKRQIAAMETTVALRPTSESTASPEETAAPHDGTLHHFPQRTLQRHPLGGSVARCRRRMDRSLRDRGWRATRLSDRGRGLRLAAAGGTSSARGPHRAYPQ